MIILAATLLACSLLHARELKRVEEKEARSLFVGHLVTLGKDPKHYAFNLASFRKSTWVISCFLKDEQPALPSRYVMNSRGEIRKMTMDSLNVVLLNEYSSLPKEEDRKDLIQDFVELHAGENVVIINKTSNIPGYDKAPADPDIARAICAPFSFGNRVSVVYTYQRIEGIVRRYRFEFENGISFKRVRCAVMGTKIGDAQYYE